MLSPQVRSSKTAAACTTAGGRPVSRPPPDLANLVCGLLSLGAQIDEFYSTLFLVSTPSSNWTIPLELTLCLALDGHLSHVLLRIGNVFVGN